MSVTESTRDFGTRFQTLRRIYLKNRKLAYQAERFAESAVWQSKQEAQPGVALPVGFPFLSLLTTGGYTTAEDLDGADASELIEWAGVSSAAAKAILAALAAL